MTATTLLADNGVTSGVTGYQLTGGNDGTLQLQTTTTGGAATTAVTINNAQAATFAQPANLPNTFGFKNRVINGNMRISQRGNLVLSNNGTTFGGPDRFFLGVSGFSTVSVIALQAGQVFSGTPYTYQVGNLLTTGGPGTVYIAQRIESANTYDLNSNTVTFSLQVLQQSGAAVNAQLVIRKANAADNFSGTTLLGASTATSVANNTSTTLTYSLALGATDASNGLQVELYFPSLAATTNAQIYTANWQFEKGAAATSFDVRPYGTELSLCQRYYWRGWQAHSANTGSYTSGCIVSFMFQYPVPMRIAPTVGQSIAGITYGGTSGFTAVASSNNNSARVNITTTATTTNAYFVMGANDYVDALAEL